MPALTAYAIVFAVAGLVTVAVTPLVRMLAEREGAVAAPDERKVHEEPTATIGGVAMLVGFLVAVGAAALLDEFDTVFASGTEIVGVVIAAVVIFAVGLIDDIREISAPAKTAGMVLAGSILSFAGVGLLVFRVPFLDLFLLSPDWSALLTVIWVLLMANAINFIDGLDGLAAGIVAIAAGTFFLYAVRLGDADVLLASNPGALIAAITLGVCVGFLPHNFHPARIFMGDSGALLLGLLMAASTMSVGGRSAEPFSGQAFFFFAPIFIPLIILAVPIIDTAFAVVRRASRRRSPLAADKEHLHHRLMKLGHGHRRSVLIMWAWTLLLCGFVLYPTYTGSGDAIVPFGIGGLMLLLYTVFHPGLRNERWSNLFRSSRSDADSDTPVG
ncbi:MAG: undecaprenyl/decaprenyl-phosphate alpha-N-acetylglucosaminyl 1-phosphate transferase [Acidimicrobiia bacterium]|nr:undecaprenyl/decaprenyl-phosphate alpha-N-acetylglucosaminyl 1-phosphate transferase [Acidimicrobiia bacterium]MDH5238122.1 undecaprenyl/decaprenyl-phosphate alpha-N-acetylglucosaminyl 1-phosphate transferase [Acidimicrobiia bacterium]